MKIKALKRPILCFFISLVCFSEILLAQEKRIALTIDDLPFVGEYKNFHLNMIKTTLEEQEIPATGFIIAREVRADNWEALKAFRAAGFALGNHTFSHANLNKLSTQEYIQDIRKADKILAEIMTKPKYFRYPYLAMSSKDKKNEVLCYLARKHYQIAPISIDSKDFVFNQRLLSRPELSRRAYLEELKPFYLDFIWHQTLKAEQKSQAQNPEQVQILLIHANLLNAYVLPDLIRLYHENNYRFVSLKTALKSIKNPIQCAASNPVSQINVRQHNL